MSLEQVLPRINFTAPDGSTQQVAFTPADFEGLKVELPRTSTQVNRIPIETSKLKPEVTQPVKMIPQTSSGLVESNTNEIPLETVEHVLASRGRGGTGKTGVKALTIKDIKDIVNRYPNSGIKIPSGAKKDEIIDLFQIYYRDHY